LRFITEWMAMSFEYPTRRGVEVKWLVQGLGAAAILFACALDWFARTRRDDEEEEPAPIERPVAADGRLLDAPIAWYTAAQLMLGFYVIWELVSCAWARWPAAALGDGVRQIIVTVWAVVLGRSLSRRGVRLAATVITAILALTALVGIWYY